VAIEQEEARAARGERLEEDAWFTATDGTGITRCHRGLIPTMNQLGRRNATPEQKSYLRGKRYNLAK
jgi:hypothetical protein